MSPLDRTPPDWHLQALCAQVDLDIFFPDKGGSTREAKSICAGCPVAAECLREALDRDERFGIWGGLSERERRRLRGPKPAVRRLQPCGTLAAYGRHLRNREKPCDPCAEANRTYQRRRRAS